MNANRSLILVIAAWTAAFAACQEEPPIHTGHWEGYLTPMNHPEMQLPMSYEVAYDDGEIGLTLMSPGGRPVATQNARLENDTLHFHFNEPEENVRLTCALARINSQNFEGRCTDPTGKWAHFKMAHPNAQ